MFKFSALDPNLTLSGPLVDEIIRAVNHLYTMQAMDPETKDYTGYSNAYLGNPILSELASTPVGSEVPIRLLYPGAQSLIIFQRQIPRGPQLFKELREQMQELERQQPQQTQEPQRPASQETVVRVLGPGRYGKVKVFIPNSDVRIPAKKRKLYEFLRNRAAELGWEQKEKTIERGGRTLFLKPDYELFKIIEDVKEEMDVWAFNPQFLGALRDFLTELNQQEEAQAAKSQRKGEPYTPLIYDLSELDKYLSGQEPGQSGHQIPASQPQEGTSGQLSGQTPQLPKIKFALKDQTQYGPTFSLTIPFVGNVQQVKQLNAEFKSIIHDQFGAWWPTYNMDGHWWFLRNLKPEKLPELAQWFAQKGFDASEIEAVAKQLVPEQSQQPETPPTVEEPEKQPAARPARLIPIVVEDVSDKSPYHLRIINPRENKDIFKELVKFSFPVYDSKGSGEGNRYSERPADQYAPWPTYVKGTYADYVEFARRLKAYNFDVTNLRTIFGNLLKKGLIKKEHISGELFEGDNPDALKSKITAKLVNPKKKLYDKQAEGVVHMYTRESAFLGDETGAGKTIQCGIAADLVTEKYGGKVVIVTLKATQIQYAKSLIDDLGVSPNDIYTPDTAGTFDASQLKKWNILTYPMFSLGERSDNVVTSLKQAGVTVMVMDEIHNVKNQSKRSGRILDLGTAIPFKWGASATISANRPIDVWRQLKGIGHRLGNLTESQFRRAFAGQVPKQQYVGRGRTVTVWEAESPQAENEAAVRLSRWLQDEAGIYIRRTKKDMNPNLPNHTVMDLPVDAKPSVVKNINAAIARRLEGYADPDLVVSQMIAERTEIARAKVPYSLELAENVLAKNENLMVGAKPKKVLIFTCFLDAANDLFAGLQKLCKDYGDGQAVMVVGGDAKRDAKVEAFKNDPNVHGMVLSILAGGTGLDVPNVVDEVIMNDYSWTPKDAEQAEGRAFRVNSEYDITTRYVLLRGTPDEEFYAIVKRKRELAALIDRPKDAVSLAAHKKEWQELNRRMVEVARGKASEATGRKQSKTKKNWLTKVAKTP